jgi:hypothetical protein
VLGALFVGGQVAKAESVGARLAGLVTILVLLGVCELCFARRMGLTIDADGISLHYAFYRRRLSWSEIEGFEWRRWRSQSTETAWIVTNRNRVRIPTIGRSTGSYLGPRLDSYFGSSAMRSRRGAEVDVMATLSAARALAVHALMR